jgi:hypothetical protein
MTDFPNHDELGVLTDLLADPSTWAEPSPGLEDAIVRAVESAQPSVRISRAPLASRARQQRTRRRRVLVAALGAAAASIAFVGGLLAVSGGGTSTAYEAQLTATAVAPGAHASASISKSDAGFRITLDAHGLPHLRDGGFYAAWLKDRAGTVVPIGTFSSSDGTVTLWSGVSPSSFRTISVTVQAAGNADARSGYRVLIGRVHAR